MINHKTNVAIFASGAGSNAAKLIAYFSNHHHIHIQLIVCNKANAGVISIASNNNIPHILIEKEQFFRGDAYTGILEEYQIHFIVLAGFLWKVPNLLIQYFPNKIINIHPSLLPKYGGKGMYGHFVHEAVLQHKETESGITIHYVNEEFDKGAPIFQAKCPVFETDTPETLATRIHALEHLHFAPTIESVICK